MPKLVRSRFAFIHRYVIAIATGSALAALTMAPAAAKAAGHTCSSGDICYYNSANYAADPPDGSGVVNPWGAVSNNYANLAHYPEPHTYNNPDVCNQAFALTARCNENDTISSVKNKSSSKGVRLFNDANYTGSYQTMDALTNLSQVRNNDQITSFCYGGGSGKCNF